MCAICDWIFHCIRTSYEAVAESRDIELFWLRQAYATYFSDIYYCWKARAPAGCAVKAWAEAFALEKDSDFAYVSCGENGWSWDASLLF